MLNNMRKLLWLYVLILVGFVPFNHAVAQSQEEGLGKDARALVCYDNPKLQQKRSAELQKLVASDQLDRGNKTRYSSKAATKIYKRDLARSKRIGEILGEGCLNSANDYLAAALIYQHGNTQDQYYQAYLWAKRALELGSMTEQVKAKFMLALSIDCYLIRIGKKQLFGTQYFNPKIDNGDSCFCIEPVEPSFPDRLRKEYTNMSLKKRYEFLSSLFNNGKNCPVKECPHTLKPTLKGTVPGLW